MGTLNWNAGPRLFFRRKARRLRFSGGPQDRPEESFSAISAERSRLALEKPLRLGGVAPRMAEKRLDRNCNAAADVVETDAGESTGAHQQSHDVAPKAGIGMLLFLHARLPSWSWRLIME